MRGLPFVMDLKRLRDRVWLTASVHYHALRHRPRSYRKALWAWVRRKRLRARSRFAPLLGAAPNAYKLWLLREQLPDRADKAEDNIVALVDLRAIGDPRKTMEALAREGIPAHGFHGLPGEGEALAAQLSNADPNASLWLMPLAAGDLVAVGAGAAYRSAISTRAATLIYADDDLIVADKRDNPYFKPEWNPELFRFQDYVSGACIVRVRGGDVASLMERPDWQTVLLREAAAAQEPVHVPKILHHRQIRPQPGYPTQIKVCRDALPPVSVVIPTRNRVDLLRVCLGGLAATDYPAVETIIVDNGSDDPETLALLDGLDGASNTVLRMPGPFNYSRLNNEAVNVARGTLLCLLNNDVEMISRDWLATLASQAIRGDVGAAGARLLYPDGRIQHAGVVIGVGGGAAHAHRFLQPEETGYFDRHRLPQFVSAVTAACLVVQRDRFLAVGGLDEVRFPVAFNDVDLCMRLNARGWRSLYEPRATLIHHESVSRGFDRDPVGAARLAGELEALKRRWGTDRVTDPYHHVELSPFSEQFVIRL